VVLTGTSEEERGTPFQQSAAPTPRDYCLVAAEIAPDHVRRRLAEVE